MKNAKDQSRVEQAIAALLDYEKQGHRYGSIHAEYPSNNWNTHSWTYRVLLDFIEFRERKRNTKFGLNFNFKEKWSYHGDSIRKLDLLSRLKNERTASSILIPEVGPMGLDVLMAVAAGYESIHVYDVHEGYLESCKSVWGPIIRSAKVMNSKDFVPTEEYKGCDYIIPDWWHGNQGSFQGLRRGFRGDLNVRFWRFRPKFLLQLNRSLEILFRV